MGAGGLRNNMSTTQYRTWPFARRETLGNFAYKNIYSNTFGYTTYVKKPAAASATGVLAATAAALTVTTVTAGITQPDVPRVLSVTPSGNTANILDGAVTVFGHNVEGKVISEVFHTASGSTSIINGTKAFLDITSIVFGQQGGTDVSFAVGTLNKLGLNHRLFVANTTVKVYTATTVYGTLTLQNAPTITASDTIELNNILPATVPDGTLIFNIFYSFDTWTLGGVDDEPIYRITTSTSSTSTSTSTTTVTTSTSSTSTSTSSTSTSTSSTSTSTSSTSTSTTTTP